LLHAVAVTLAFVSAFMSHSCLAGPALPPERRGDGLAPPPFVQVGLGRCLRDESARVAVRGPYEVRARGETLSHGDALAWSDVRVVENGLSLGEARFAEKVLALVPLRDGTLEVEYRRDPRGQSCPPAVARYRGTLLVHALADRKLALANEVDLEEYLKGVVGKEMNLAEGVEALKTQVIAARTYAVHEQRLGRLRRVRGERFDLYDDERSQVYGGMERETALAARLVEETRGLFLVYEGRLVRAFYSSACGGRTEPAWEAMGDEGERIPPLGGVKCGYCERRPVHRWKEPAVIAKKEIVEKCLPAELRAARVRGVEVTRTLPGGHALEVTVSLEGSSRTVKLHAQDFRRALSHRFRSLLWDRIEDRGETIAISGRGYGHGVGMCQTGAYEMARDGKQAAEILEYYFPGARVQKLY
jgi:stage II sporulation protein D